MAASSVMSLLKRLPNSSDQEYLQLKRLPNSSDQEYLQLKRLPNSSDQEYLQFFSEQAMGSYSKKYIKTEQINLREWQQWQQKLILYINITTP